MTENPFFSVVIPTYNRAAFIEKTLATVLSQTDPHYEIIVVDNCSTDNTVEMLQPYIAAGQIKFIQHERNLERASSRNTGMGSAKGDFVTFLDSDDFMYPHNLEDAARFAVENPTLKCFHNLYETVNAAGKVVYRPPFPDLTNPIKAIVHGNFMSCIGDFIHREIYQQYRFDTESDIIGGEDWEFWLRVLAKYKVGRISKVNSGVLQHEGRSMNSQTILTMAGVLERIMAKLSADPTLAEAYRPYFKRLRATCALYLATLANAALEFGTARRYLLEAAKRDPSVIATRRFIRLSQIALMRLDTRRA